MTMHVKDATVWKTASPKVRDAGVWKQVQTGSVWDGGVWRPFLNNVGFSVTVNNTAPSEVNGTAVFTVTASAPVSTYITYEILDNGYGGWSTSDYNVSNTYDNGKPTGIVFFNNETSKEIHVQNVYADHNESTEYYYVAIRVGNNVPLTEPIVAASPIVAVANVPYCIWAQYGRPEWC